MSEQTHQAQPNHTAGVLQAQIRAEASTEAGIDPLLSHHLAVTSDDPELFALVLEGANASGEHLPEGTKLVSTALSRLGAWVGSGLRCVPSVERVRRLQICAGCPHVQTREMRGLHRLVSWQQRDAVCGLCGCIVRHKARLATETCPDRSAGGRGRWDEGGPDDGVSS